MWNPIVSGSTDLWQHVWMYYSMPVEVREAGERTQDYRHKQQQSECMSFRKCKEQKYTDKNNICFFLPVSVVAHYATDWNLESIHRAEPSRAEPSRAVASSYSCQKKKKIKDGVWPCRVTLKFCSTDPVTAHTEGPNNLFLLLSCSISSLENWVTPPSFFSSISISISILHSEPPSLLTPPPDTKRSSLRRKPCC